MVFVMHVYRLIDVLRREHLGHHVSHKDDTIHGIFHALITVYLPGLSNTKVSLAFSAGSPVNWVVYPRMRYRSGRLSGYEKVLEASSNLPSGLNSIVGPSPFQSIVTSAPGQAWTQRYPLFISSLSTLIPSPSRTMVASLPIFTCLGFGNFALNSAKVHAKDGWKTSLAPTLVFILLYSISFPSTSTEAPARERYRRAIL
mmetsp:Transcript_18236/g.25354  ORF Transcript_18236/g.25354 Transcript_18236/m.25354 type:complete len:200 (+) Transcript_18236:247-846(+)